MINEKKKNQLGMDPGTAAGQLKKMILFDFVKTAHLDTCFHCGNIIKSENELSIEHKVPWLDSEDAKGLFFDLNNIAFSHLKCNIQAGRKTNKKYFSLEEKKEAKNRMNRESWTRLGKEEQKRQRKEKYKRNDC